MKIEWLKAKCRRTGSTFQRFDRWLGETASLCDQFWASTNAFKPSQDNEASAVSILLAGAARAGFLPVSEYRLRKRSLDHRRRWKDGRAELSFVADDQAYSFEFRRLLNAGSLSNLRKVMSRAKENIRRIPKVEYDFAFAGVLAPVYEEAGLHVYQHFADKVDFCCKLGTPESSKVYLHFDGHA